MKSKDLAIKYGEKVKRLRQDFNLTQEEFAKKIKTTQKNITRWESGESLISTYFLNEICRIFNIKMSYWDIEKRVQGEFFLEEISRKEFEHLCERIGVLESQVMGSAMANRI